MACGRQQELPWAGPGRSEAGSNATSDRAVTVPPVHQRTRWFYITLHTGEDEEWERTDAARAQGRVAASSPPCNRNPQTMSQCSAGLGASLPMDLFSALPPFPLLPHHSTFLRHQGTSSFPPLSLWFLRGQGIIFCLPQGIIGLGMAPDWQAKHSLPGMPSHPGTRGGKQMISCDCIWDNTSLAVGAARRVPAEPEQCYSWINLHYNN